MLRARNTLIKLASLAHMGHKNENRFVPDTISIQVADRDTAIFHNWIIHHISEFNHAPEVISCSPPLDTTLFRTDSIIFNIHCHDPDGDIESVQIRVDGGLWETAEGKADWSYELDTTKIVDGEHTISIRAFDGEGYSEEIDITITIDQKGEEESAFEWDLNFILLVIVIVAVLIILPASAIKLSSKKR